VLYLTEVSLNRSVSELKISTFSFDQEFEDDVENWRGSITAVNQCGEHLVQEFLHYESGELKNSMSELSERWTNITSR